MTDYLWDKTGEDAEVERLEELLSPYRFDRPFVFPAVAPRPWFVRGWFRLAMAGAAAAVIIAAVLFFAGTQGNVQWRAQRSLGVPRLNDKVMAGAESFAVGSVITTDARSEVELKAAGHGRIRVLPGSDVRLLESGDRHQRLDLRRGTIEASLYAPPFMFSFDTPSGTAYDIGCAFRLSVGDDKSGLVEVLSGWVQFEVGESQELAPAGAAIAIVPGYPPGTAVYEDASPAFRAAIHTLDFGDPSQRQAALNQAMAEARAKDVYTLLRLMREATPDERGLLFDRASRLKPPPAWVTRDGVMRHEQAMMDAWMDAWNLSLGLGDPKRWWVHWKDRF